MKYLTHSGTEGKRSNQALDYHRISHVPYSQSQKFVVRIRP